jgi:hypothetical protein
MLLTLVAADFTGPGASMQCSARHGGLEGSLAGEDPRGCQAEVGAIEAEADTANHLLNILLSEVGVNIGSTGLLAVDACPDALYECVHIPV